MTSAASANDMFHAFVLQQQQFAMVYLGKLANPVTGDIERNLEAARWSIDLLGMLQEKARGNLSKDEERLLVNVLTNLRLNFVEEAAKGTAAETDPREPGESPSGRLDSDPDA